MKTGKLIALILLNFAIAIAAGVIAARTLARPVGSPPPGTSPALDSNLASQLQLTPEQTEKMRSIWEDARDVARDCAHEADRIQKDNDASLQALLTEPQKAEYEKISAENKRRVNEQDAKRKDAFRVAVEQTRTILRPDQWQAYEQILKNQVGTLP